MNKVLQDCALSVHAPGDVHVARVVVHASSWSHACPQCSCHWL